MHGPAIRPAAPLTVDNDSQHDVVSNGCMKAFSSQSLLTDGHMMGGSLNAGRSESICTGMILSMQAAGSS